LWPVTFIKEGGITIIKEYLLKIDNVSKVFRIGNVLSSTRMTAVDNINLSISSEKPVILSIVGESGSGKTTLARMILRLLEPTSGRIYLQGRDLFSLRDSESLVEFKRTVQPIFQNPYETFNPLKSVSQYLYDTVSNLRITEDQKDADEIISETLASVNLDLPTVKGKFPSQFSGGELQRISIARALIPKPRLIVADEPVSMLDASLRMNIINLFDALKNTYNISFIYITHDLSTAYYISDFVAIMYRGCIVEYGPSDLILMNPMHPYTKLLISSVAETERKWNENIKLSGIESQEFLMTGCKFALRCEEKEEICNRERPPEILLADGRMVSCFKYNKSNNVESLFKKDN